MGFRRLSQSPTTIYLDEDQRKTLFKLAAERNSSFSSEIRVAIDRYVEEKELALSEEEALLLVHQANEVLTGWQKPSMKRMRLWSASSKAGRTRRVMSWADEALKSLKKVILVILIEEKVATLADDVNLLPYATSGNFRSTGVGSRATD